MTYRATRPAQYIHLIFLTIPVQNEPDAVVYLAVDNYSEVAFEPLTLPVFNISAAARHIEQVMQQVSKTQPTARPTFVMGYGKAFWQELQRACPYTLIYDPPEANRIALPVAEFILEEMQKRLE